MFQVIHKKNTFNNAIMLRKHEVHYPVQRFSEEQLPEKFRSGYGTQVYPYLLVLTLFCCFYFQLWTDFTQSSGVFLVDFEQENFGLEEAAVRGLYKKEAVLKNFVTSSRKHVKWHFATLLKWNLLQICFTVNVFRK